MNEEEEFEFRLRLEREQAAPANPTVLDSIKGAVKGAATAQLAPFKLGLKANEIYERGSDVVGSAITEGGSRIGLPSEAAAGLGTAAYVGMQALPAIAGGGLVGSAGKQLMESGARRLMQSSIKPDKFSRTTGDAPKAITTMLEKGINATEGGMAATQSKVTSLENRIQGILDNSLAKVDVDEVAIKTLKDSLKKITYNTDPKSDMVIIDKAINTFLEHPQVEGLSKITVATANKLKQGIYAELKNNKYGIGLPKPSTEVMTDKVRAANLREAVATNEPTVAPSLAEQAELLNVLKVAGPQVSREGNKNIVGMGWISPSMERTAMWMLDRYPWFKSMLARGMYAGSERLPQAAVGMGVAAGEALTQRK